MDPKGFLKFASYSVCMTKQFKDITSYATVLQSLQIEANYNNEATNTLLRIKALRGNFGVSRVANLSPLILGFTGFAWAYRFWDLP